MMGNNNQLLRIGVFYDGQYFFKVSNYYNFEHRRKARISISGLHEFIRKQVSDTCNTDYRLCQIVDAHYFRGRLSAQDASRREKKLYNERLFDEILMGENVIAHYMPLRSTVNGEKQEKGIDVWLALEAYELAIHKRFDVLVLLACDGDYVPLVRKLNTLGTRVMLLGWDFEYTDKYAKKCVTRTSQQLLEEVTYPVAMHQLIDDRVKGQASDVSGIFHSHKAAFSDDNAKESTDDIHQSTIIVLKDGYGFIRDAANNNVFFHNSSLENTDFNSLSVGQKVKYTRVQSDEGKFSSGSVWAVTE